MEFGPTDRFDVIELKGFDEHEVERDGMCKILAIVTALRLSRSRGGSIQ